MSTTTTGATAAARLRAAAGHLQTSALLLGILGGLSMALAELSTFAADRIGGKP